MTASHTTMMPSTNTALRTRARPTPSDKLKRLPRNITPIHTSTPQKPTEHTVTQRVNKAILSLVAFTGSSAVAAVAAAADVADSAVEVVDQTTGSSGGGLLAPLSDGLEVVLKLFQTGLDTLHVPYTYGWSIIALTLLVKVVTFPFLKKQVESSLAMQALKPRIDRIKARYGEDKEKVQRETTILYEEAGVDPTAGCLPTLATIPIFIGLYGSLTNVAKEGLLDAQGFYWIPSLAGPTSIADRAAGAGTAWLLPLVDGQPPIGWEEAALYLVLPVLLVAVQVFSTAVISPPVDPNDENAKNQRLIFGFLPLMIGWFSLNVPSGLTLYYVANTVLTTAAQIYLKKFGGANVVMNDLGPVTKLGSGRRLGAVAQEEPWTWAMAEAAAGQDPSGEGSAAAAEAAAAVAASVSGITAADGLGFRSKRRKVKVKKVVPVDVDAQL